MKTVCLVLGLFFFGHSYAQDSLVKVKIDSFAKSKLSYENLDTFQRYLDFNSKTYGWSTYLSERAYFLWQQGINDSAVLYADSSIAQFNRLTNKNALDEKSLLQSYMVKGYILRTNKAYSQSTQNFIKALEVEKKYPNKFISYLRAAMANNHLSLGNNRKALDLYHKNIKDTFYISRSQPHVVTLTRLGHLYMKNYLNNQDSAYYYLKKAENVSYTKDYTSNLPFIYANLGSIFKGANIDSTLYYFKKSEEQYSSYEIITNESPSNSDMAILVNNSFVDIHENNYDKAIENLKIAISHLEQNMDNKNDRDILLDAYDHLILGFERQGNFKEAGVHLKKKEAFVMVFHKQELESELNKLQVTFEIQQKEERIKQLQLTNELKDAEVERQKFTMWAGAVIAGLVLLGSILFFQQKHLNQENKKIALEQRLLRSQMNPHFIFNVLQSLSNMIVKTPQKAEKFIVEFGSLLRLTLENSREDYVELADELKALTHYTSLNSETGTPFDFKLMVDGVIDTSRYFIPPMLLQPLVENAIKHGISSKRADNLIELEISPYGQEFLCCQVRDNGKGFKKSGLKKNKSLALTIVQERLGHYRKPKGIRPISIESGNGTAFTKVTLYIPFILD